MSVPIPPYPMLLTPVLVPKVWGGRSLASLGKALPAATLIGESWELSDLDESIAGAASRSVVANGPLAGKTVRDACQAWGKALLGEARTAVGGGFPLLTKFLDAREHLSVQVHPSPAYASAHPESHLKTESWTVVAAEARTELFIGIKPGTSRDDLARCIAEGTVPDAMVRLPAVVGETHLLPSGTCHALGAGIVVAEIQTPSDTTFRVYDWTREYNRAKRELHIDQALECIDFDARPTPVRLDDGAKQGRVVTTDMFTVDELRLSCEELPIAGSAANRPIVITVLATMGGSVRDDLTGTEVEFRAGSTVLVPASIADRCVIASGPGTRLLRTTVL